MYESPVIEIVNFPAVDIITTSGKGDNATPDDEL